MSEFIDSVEISKGEHTYIDAPMPDLKKAKVKPWNSFTYAERIQNSDHEEINKLKKELEDRYDTFNHILEKPKTLDAVVSVEKTMNDLLKLAGCTAAQHSNAATRLDVGIEEVEAKLRETTLCLNKLKDEIKFVKKLFVV